MVAITTRDGPSDASVALLETTNGHQISPRVVAALETGSLEFVRQRLEFAQATLPGAGDFALSAGSERRQTIWFGRALAGRPVWRRLALSARREVGRPDRSEVTWIEGRGGGAIADDEHARVGHAHRGVRSARRRQLGLDGAGVLVALTTVAKRGVIRHAASGRIGPRAKPRREREDQQPHAEQRHGRATRGDPLSPLGLTSIAARGVKDRQQQRRREQLAGAVESERAQVEHRALEQLSDVPARPPRRSLVVLLQQGLQPILHGYNREPSQQDTGNHEHQAAQEQPAEHAALRLAIAQRTADRARRAEAWLGLEGWRLGLKVGLGLEVRVGFGFGLGFGLEVRGCARVACELIEEAGHHLEPQQCAVALRREAAQGECVQCKHDHDRRSLEDIDGNEVPRKAHLRGL
eukprot:scaffold2788_cov69-Phaeocystis_antarctica.AAC.8